MNFYSIYERDRLLNPRRYPRSDANGSRRARVARRRGAVVHGCALLRSSPASLLLSQVFIVSRDPEHTSPLAIRCGRDLKAEVGNVWKGR